MIMSRVIEDYQATAELVNSCIVKSMNKLVKFNKYIATISGIVSHGDEMDKRELRNLLNQQKDLMDECSLVINDCYKTLGVDNKSGYLPEIADVKVKGNKTIVFWEDNTKTVVELQKGDTYDKEKAISMAICKKAMGSKYFDIIRNICNPKTEKKVVPPMPYVELWGKRYGNLKQLCDQYGFNYQIVKDGVKKENLTLIEAIDKAIMSVSIDKFSATEVRNYIKTHKCTVEEAVEELVFYGYDDIRFCMEEFNCNFLEAVEMLDKKSCMEADMDYYDVLDVQREFNLSYKNAFMYLWCEINGYDYIKVKRFMKEQNVSFEEVIKKYACD